MAKEIKTEIEIQATPERVWEVLTNFEAYPTWNPFIRKISGSQHEGDKLSIEIHLPGKKPMTFTPKILQATPPQAFRWLGSAGIKGIFDGEHYFNIIPLGNGAVKFVHGENFRGLLVEFMSGMLKKTRLGFEAMNEALKRTCEQRCAPQIQR